MLSEKARKVAKKARDLYDDELREPLERDHHGNYVCIEPESGDYFVGATFDDAVNQAIDVHPDCLTHTLRIGFSAALHLGAAYQ